MSSDFLLRSPDNATGNSLLNQYPLDLLQVI